MYIVNPEVIGHKIKLKKIFAQYFINKDIPLLSKRGEYYYFADSVLFRNEFENAPFWIKWGVQVSS